MAFKKSNTPRFVVTEFRAMKTQALYSSPYILPAYLFLQSLYLLPSFFLPISSPIFLVSVQNFKSSFLSGFSCAPPSPAIFLSHTLLPHSSLPAIEIDKQRQDLYLPRIS
jgi:hypothetical protein